MEKLQYICGVTFAPFAPAGSFTKECAEESADDEGAHACQFRDSGAERITGYPAVGRDLLYF